MFLLDTALMTVAGPEVVSMESGTPEFYKCEPVSGRSLADRRRMP